MSSINFEVGMSINEVIKLAKSAKVSNEIKTLIFNFCNQDLDEKITDDIEIHILKTWFSGEKRIKMPGIKGNWNALAKCGSAIASYFGKDEVEKRAWESSDGRKYEQITTWEYGFGGLFNPGNITESMLVDNDNDGLADSYYTGCAKDKLPNSQRRNIGI